MIRRCPGDCRLTPPPPPAARPPHRPRGSCATYRQAKWRSSTGLVSEGAGRNRRRRKGVTATPGENHQPCEESPRSSLRWHHKVSAVLTTGLAEPPPTHPRVPQVQTVADARPQATAGSPLDLLGLMFWFNRDRLSGSHLSFGTASRSYLRSPKASRTRSVSKQGSAPAAAPPSDPPPVNRA